MTRILLLGANGKIGSALVPRLRTLGELTTCARAPWANLHTDLTDLKALRRELDTLKPDLIVNAAAYTAVDKAETDAGAATAMNADLPTFLGEWAAWHAATVIHYSSDYVFDGKQTRPYRETDTANPLSVYGRSKLAGDEALLLSGARAFILRCGWIYSFQHPGFADTVLRLLEKPETLRIVNDQIGTPTWCHNVADYTTHIVSVLMSRDSGVASAGLYHLAPVGQASWYDFACAIRDTSGCQRSIVPIAARTFARPAIRPAFSVLDTTLLTQQFEQKMPDWRESFCRAFATAKLRKTPSLTT